MLEALLVAAMAGTLASVSAGFINRAILRFKKHRKQARRHEQPPGPDQSVEVDLDLY